MIVSSTDNTYVYVVNGKMSVQHMKSMLKFLEDRSVYTNGQLLRKLRIFTSSSLTRVLHVSNHTSVAGLEYIYGANESQEDLMKLTVGNVDRIASMIHIMNRKEITDACVEMKLYSHVMKYSLKKATEDLEPLMRMNFRYRNGGA